MCQATVHVPECDGYGSQCDHIDRGDDHSLTNLQWLSQPCHTAKTQQEALAGHHAHYASLRRQPEGRPDPAPEPPGGEG